MDHIKIIIYSNTWLMYTNIFLKNKWIKNLKNVCLSNYYLPNCEQWIKLETKQNV